MSSFSTKPIKNFIETHIAYLTDNGFKINYGILVDLESPKKMKAILTNDKNNPDAKILVHKNEYGDLQRIKAEEFSWNDISDSFIPFLNILKDEFFITEIAIRRASENRGQKYLVDNILKNENDFMYDDILSIELYIPCEYYDTFISDRWDNGKGFHTLYEDNDVLVLIEKYVIAVSRVYYVIFKKKSKNDICRVVKLSYNLNRGFSYNDLYSNITVTLNNNRIIPFTKLEYSLRSSNLDFDIFNNAWHYIEDNYVNR